MLPLNNDKCFKFIKQKNVYIKKRSTNKLSYFVMGVNLETNFTGKIQFD